MSLCDNVGKFNKARADTGDNIVHVLFMLGNKVYKHTLTEYVTIIAFPLQQCLHECSTMLSYMYIVCLVDHYFQPGV